MSPLIIINIIIMIISLYIINQNKKIRMANMKIINIEAIQQLLNDNSISAYSIEKESGFSRDTLAKLRRNETAFDKLSLKSLKSLKQLQSFINNQRDSDHS